LRKYGFEARRGQQFKGTEDSPDVIHDMTGLAVEVKLREAFSINDLYKTVDKAQEDAAADEDAVVFYRRNKKPWLAVMDGERFVELLQELYDDAD
jgi:hypothetical protein